MDTMRIAEALNGVLADTYLLQVKLQSYHWNVVGPNFHSLHEMFEKQYTEVFVAVDAIAEQIRTLGHLAPGTMAEMLELASIREGDATLPAPEMLADLVQSHELVLARVHECAHVADDEDDESTEDLMTQRMNAHRKMIWMLKATAGLLDAPANRAMPVDGTLEAAPAKPPKSSKAGDKGKKKAVKAVG